MRMKATTGSQMEELDGVSVIDKGWWAESVPSEGAIDRLSIDVEGLGHVLHEPDIVLILVGIESDLLLLAAGRIHQVMRMQVASLGVVVSDADSATQGNIDWDILHGLGVESGLELGAHESISISWVGQAEEVDSEHCHIE